MQVVGSAKENGTGWGERVSEKLVGCHPLGIGALEAGAGAGETDEVGWIGLSL